MDDRVRGGGHASPEGWVYEIYGDNLALDFANTVDGRKTGVLVERLVTYEELLRWAEQSRALAAPQVTELRRAAAAHPRATTLAVTRAREVREVAHDIFLAAAEQRPLPPAAVAELDARLGAAFGAPHLALPQRVPVLQWERETPRLDSVAHAAARAAVELLTAPDKLARVRVCALDTCGWLFLDTSRNGSRRWCDMTICGNRAKARRHYRRTQGRA
jgi:predicted RNA-binding Zn ribbon-like protein